MLSINYSYNCSYGYPLIQRKVSFGLVSLGGVRVHILVEIYDVNHLPSLLTLDYYCLTKD